MGFLLTEGVTAPNNVNALPITNNRFGVLDDDDFDDLPFLIIGTAVCVFIPGNKKSVSRKMNEGREIVRD